MTDHGLLLAAIEGEIWGPLRDVLLLLAGALLVGTLVERLRQSVIVGYLLAGTLLGPNVLNWISGQQQLFQVAELGVALLLFTIGLEFSPRRLLNLGGRMLVVGALQVVLTAALGWGGAYLFGYAPGESLVIGLMVAMSSTASVLRLLADRAELDSSYGRAALGILLVQDIAVVPMMILLSALGQGGSAGEVASKLAISLGLAVLLVGAFYLLLNVLAPRLMLLPSWRRNRDLPILLAVILAAGSAWAAHLIGLSPALGAFVAGVMLAVSPYAPQIRADVRPLGTVMVTLFFAAIGTFGDPQWLVDHALQVAAIVLAVVLGKPLVIALLGGLFRQPWRYAIACGLCLAQIGEFSFVLATIAQSDALGEPLMSGGAFRTMVSATIVTLLVTPYVVAIAPQIGIVIERWILRWRPRELQPAGKASVRDSQSAIDPHAAPDDAVLIVGFGPAGQRVAEGLLEGFRERLVVLDMNPENLRVAQLYGLHHQLGDATQSDLLEHAGIYRAQAVVVTLPHPATARQVIYLVREMCPQALVLVRSRYHIHRWELIHGGAQVVVDEEDEVGRQLAGEVRALLGKV